MINLLSILFQLLVLIKYGYSIGCDEWASLISTECLSKLVTKSGEIVLKRDGKLYNHINDVDDDIDHVRISYAEYYHSDAQYSLLTPILIVHGGPGLPYTYLDTYKYLICDSNGNNNKYRVIFYDQFCVGTSTKDCNSDTTSNWPELSKMLRYMNEIKSVIDITIGNQMKFHLLGQSGGGSLVSQFGVTYNSFINSGQVLSLILANPATPNFQLFAKGMHDNVIGSLPLKYRDVLQPNNVSDPLYNEAYSFFEREYFLRTSGDYPDCISDSFNGFNYPLYSMFMSDCDWCYWTARGDMGNLDITNDINQIKIPILYFISEFDIISEHDADLFYRNNRKYTTVYIISGASHLSHIESFDETYKLVNCWMNELCQVTPHNIGKYIKAKQDIKDLTPQFTRNAGGVLPFGDFGPEASPDDEVKAVKPSAFDNIDPVSLLIGICITLIIVNIVYWMNHIAKKKKTHQYKSVSVDPSDL